jgi:hypothetical protein
MACPLLAIFDECKSLQISKHNVQERRSFVSVLLQ